MLSRACGPRTVTLLACAVTLLGIACSGVSGQIPPTVPEPARPNIILIVTDDQDVATLAQMPRLQNLLVQQGTTFENMFVTYPLCCPSRASILTGQYPHNTDILGNHPPLGGFAKFRDGEREGSTVATWLQSAGYRTALFGKYLNGYTARQSSYKPPGWDEWYASLGHYFGYRISENGEPIAYGDSPEDYETDVLTRKVIAFIEGGEANDAQPFFVYFAPYAPHAPAIPAPRHEGAFAHVSAPRPPSFDEADVSDKPPAVRRLSPLNGRQVERIDADYRRRLESLLAVDEAIETLIDSLARHGELDRTYVFFTSDNGFHLGQHRLRRGKNQVYEEDIRVPLIVRGPGVPAGVSLPHLVLNIDLAPTFAEMARTAPGHMVDGRSLAPLVVERAPPPEQWRQDFLIEIYRPSGDAIRALRTTDMLYAEYASGPRELYDLTADPFQLENSCETADPDRLRQLSARLATLASCSGEACR